MTVENEFVFHMLSDFLSGKETIIPKDTCLDKIQKICKDHGIEGILYHQIYNTTVREDFLNGIKVAYLNTIFCYTNRKAFLKEMDKQFELAGIPYFIFKGTEIADVYPVPQLRTMGDVDVLVHPKDKEKAGEIWEKLGLQNHCHGGNEWIYYRSGMEYELHSRMMNEETANLPKHSAFMNQHWCFAKADDDSIQYHLDWNFHFVFLLLHLRKHFLNSGAGIRQFMDVAVVAQRCSLDWAWIEDRLCKLEIEPFAETVFALCEKWFGISFPFKCNIDSVFFEEASVKVVEDGVFGFSKKENANNSKILNIQTDRMYGVKCVLTTVFPSYQVLRTLPKYSFIEGKPLLLPFIWIYRIISTVVAGKFISSTRVATEALSVSKGQRTERELEIKKWGL